MSLIDQGRSFLSSLAHEEYSKEQKMFLVKPGITGWAQVNGEG